MQNEYAELKMTEERLQHLKIDQLKKLSSDQIKESNQLITMESDQIGKSLSKLIDGHRGYFPPDAKLKSFAVDSSGQAIEPSL